MMRNILKKSTLVLIGLFIFSIAVGGCASQSGKINIKEDTKQAAETPEEKNVLMTIARGADISTLVL